MRFLPEPKAGVVLELAHGTGDLQVDLLQAGYRTVGIDLSRSMGLLAQRKTTEQGFGAALFQGESAFLPVSSDSISALVSTFPTSFIFHPKTQSEIHRVLKPEGQAVVVLSALLTRRGLLTGAIRILHELTGQTYCRIAVSEIHRRFRRPGLTAQAHTLHLDGSLAQIVILRKATHSGQTRHDISLDLARKA